MTVPDLFRILLKVAAMYLLIAGFTVNLPQLIVLFQSSRSPETFTVAIVVTVLFILMVILFLFNTNWIVEKLELGKGFDSPFIDVAITDDVVLKVATIVIGGLMFIENIGPFLVQSYQMLKAVQTERAPDDVSWQNARFALVVIELVIGILLLSNYDTVARLINRDRVSKPDPVN